MHNAAIDVTEVIKDALWRGSGAYGVPAATAIIHLAEINSNKTFHAHLNVIGVQVEYEKNHLLTIVGGSSSDQIKAANYYKKGDAAAATQILKDANKSMDNLYSACIDELQKALNQAGSASNRYVYYAKKTGRTNDLVHSVDNCYNRFNDYVDIAVYNLLANKYAVISTTVDQLSAYLPNVNEVRLQFNSTFKRYV